MATFTQKGRPLAVETPLGEDVLLLASLQAVEGISQPFHLTLDMFNEPAKPVAFEGLLGQPVTVLQQPAGAPARYFHGIVSRLVQGRQVHSADNATLNRYRAEVVPRFALLKKRIQNRIFQQMTVPAILAEVLTGLDVRFSTVSTYQPRDYCVQYRESDFAFASRLMEEEGISYFFEHSKSGHVMVITDTATAFAPLPEQRQLIYSTLETLPANERRVRDWEKQQEVVSGQYSARDHSFELQDHDLEYQQTLTGQVAIGSVSHVLASGPAKDLTIADFPGRYAQRFDGISANGDAQADALAKIFDDGPRTVRIRMEQEAVESLKIRGVSEYSHATPGYTFALERHFNANGDYLFTQVKHSAGVGDSYLSGQEAELTYTNRFECIPKGLTYRPRRQTPGPIIAGTQSATVVGPKGEQLYCDKYGRVKVQFRWDRAGKHDSRSSCWLRVSQPSAGKGFGSFHLPRIGQEVMVAFEEGDPDKPIVIGSVYNSTMRTPFPLPEYATQTGFKSSTLHGDSSNFSGLGFDDTPGYEHVQLHSERHQTQSAEENLFVNVGEGHHVTIGKSHTRQVGGIPGINGYFVAAGGEKGSGSGGGASSSTWSASQTGPYTWDFGVLGEAFAQDKSLVFGWQNTCTIGIGASSTQTCIMTAVRNYLNPSYLVHGIGGAALGVLAGMPGLSGFVGNMGTNFATADWKVSIGGSTSICYGPRFHVHRGAQIDATGDTSSAWAKLAAGVYFGLTAISEVLPALAPATRYTSAGMHWATLVKLPESICLGVWKGLELATKQAGVLVDVADASLLTAAFAHTFPTFALSNWAPIGDVLLSVGEMGAPKSTLVDDGKRCHMAASLYTVAAPQICLLSQGTVTTTPHICLEAGSEETDGYVSLLASKSTMLTGGPMAMACLTTSAASGAFSANAAGADGTIKLTTGPAEAPTNSIMLSDLGVAVRSAETGVFLTAGPEDAAVSVTPLEISLALTENIFIKLTGDGIQMQYGACTLQLGADGLTLQGPNVTVAADASYKISSGAVAVAE